MAVLSAAIAVENLTLLAKNGRLLLAWLFGTQLARRTAGRRCGAVGRLGELFDDRLHGPVARQVLGPVLVKVDDFVARCDWTTQRYRSGRCCRSCCRMDVTARPAAAAAAHHHSAVRLAQNGQLIRIVAVVALQFGEELQFGRRRRQRLVLLILTAARMAGQIIDDDGLLILHSAAEAHCVEARQ